MAYSVKNKEYWPKMFFLFMHKLYLKWLKFLCNFIAWVRIESYNIVSKQPVSGQFIIIITKPLQQPFLMALFTIILFYISNFWSCTQNNMMWPFILGSKGWRHGESARLPPMLPACRRLLFPLLHAEKGCLRNAVANRVPASRWQGILFRINCEIISG